MLLLVRADRAEVAETLDRARVEAGVGPTDDRGWTAAWCAHGSLALFAGRTDVIGFWDAVEEQDTDDRQGRWWSRWRGTAEAERSGQGDAHETGVGAVRPEPEVGKGSGADEAVHGLVAEVAGPSGSLVFRSDGKRTEGDLPAFAAALAALFPPATQAPVRPVPVPLSAREEKQAARRERRHPVPDRPDHLLDPERAVVVAFERSRGWVDELVEGLEHVLALPRVGSAPTERIVVLQRGDESLARMAARIAANTTGPVRMTRLGDGWHALEPSTPTEVDELFTALAGVVAAAGPRRNPVVALWRAPDGACGVDVARGDTWFGRSTWGTGWLEVGPRDTELADDLAAFLAFQVAGKERDHVDMVALRSLVRADDRTRDPLEELSEVLGLPRQGVALLDGIDPPDHLTEVVTPAGFFRTWREAVRDDAGYEPRLPRPVRVAGAWLTVAAAVVLLLLAGVMIATVATDGAFVDEPSATGEDWAFTALAVVLFLLAAGAARGRFRRLRSSRPQP